MSVLNLVIKTPDGEVFSSIIDSNTLSTTITNVKLYDRDLEFIRKQIDESQIQNTQILPVDEGILIIDMVDNLIMDSQGHTGVNKVTPAEIKMSKRGNTPGETTLNSTILRFKELVESGRLKGFEEWYDNGTGLNTEIKTSSFDDLMITILETNPYGQFIFDTKPFKVVTFCETDYTEQYELFNMLVKHNFLSSDNQDWKHYLEKLK